MRNLLRRASGGHYNLIDHITTSATTMPTRQYATQTLVLQGMALISQGGVVMLNRIEDSFIDASGFFLDLDTTYADRFRFSKKLVGQFAYRNDIGADGLGDVGRNPRVEEVGAAGAQSKPSARGIKRLRGHRCPGSRYAGPPTRIVARFQYQPKHWAGSPSSIKMGASQANDHKTAAAVIEDLPRRQIPLAAFIFWINES
ncbi:hypothetical protein [Mesorhizobium caraganae]|uniref:hypothetical protein n=1 Tax=Mesorhizobium caraganae TaxID=483206 RepID=UPI00406AB4F0